MCLKKINLGSVGQGLNKLNVFSARKSMCEHNDTESGSEVNKKNSCSTQLSITF